MTYQAGAGAALTHPRRAVVVFPALSLSSQSSLSSLSSARFVLFERPGSFAIRVFGATPEAVAGIGAFVSRTVHHPGLAGRAFRGIGLQFRVFGLSRFRASFQAGGGHAFPDAAASLKVLFQSLELTREQSTRNIHQHQRRIRRKLRVEFGALNGPSGRCFARILSAGSTLSKCLHCLFPNPLGHFIRVFASPVHQLLTQWVRLLPDWHPPLPQEVLIIEFQLFQAGAGHVGQLNFGLFRGAGSLRGLGNVLDAGACGLHHLVACAAETVDVFIHKPYRHVKCQLRRLKAFQFPVATMVANEAFRHLSQLHFQQRQRPESAADAVEVSPLQHDIQL